MIEINDNVVFVNGALKGAIYDFNTGNVFWVNEDACELFEKIKTKQRNFNREEEEYLSLLSEKKLFCRNFDYKSFLPAINETPKIDLAWLEVTQACNLRCVHCYEGQDHFSCKDSLSLAEWKDLILQLSDNNVGRVVVIGGEPCLHHSIKEILQYLRHKQIDTTIFTNGTAMTDDLINFIAAHNVKVKVSLYGHNSSVHDAVTQIPGSFDRLMANLNKLIQLGVRLNIAVIVMLENQMHIDKIRVLIESLGLPYAGYDVIRNTFHGSQSLHQPTNFDVLKKSLRLKPDFRTTKEQFSKNYSRNSCWFGKLAITENGDVIPCVFERNFVCGNIKKNRLNGILRSPELEKCWNLSFDQVNICNVCEFRFACKDCRPLGFSTRGFLFDKNPRCLYNPKLGVWASSVSAGK